jgi:hypothetical protein
VKRLSSQPAGATEEDMHMADPPRYPDTDERTGVPRWVWVVGIIVVLVVLLVVILMLTGVFGGGHRPGPPPGGH